MENKEFAKKLEDRTLKFGVTILKFSEQLPVGLEANVVRNQLSKSGTSVGANYHEANRARSRVDFANKVKISESEASETVYWLKVVCEMNWISLNKLEPILKEANELLAILTSIGKNLKL